MEFRKITSCSISLTFSILFASLTFTEVCAAPPLPPQSRQFVQLDQFSNISTRKREIFNLAKSQPIKIYEFELDPKAVDVYLSKNASKAQINRIFNQTSQNTKKVKFYLVDEPGVPYQDFKTYFGEPTQKLWATKLQGSATYHVWDPTLNTPLFDLKIQKLKTTFGQPEITNVVNSSSNALRAITQNDEVENKVKNLPHELFDILPERVGASVDMYDFSYTYWIRELEPLAGPLKTDQIRLPAHGLLGKTLLLEDLAKKRNLSTQKWIESEFIAKLAKISAHTNFKLGIYFENHTQNLNLIINTKTGAIDKILSKDLSDLMFDDLIPFLDQKPLLQNHTFSVVTNKIYDYFPGAAQARQPGYNLAIYTGQSLTGLSTDPIQKKKNAIQFLKSYVNEVQNITGIKIQWPPKTKRVLDSLLDFNDGKNLSSYSRQWGDTSAALAEIVQEIHDQVKSKKIESLNKTVVKTHITYEQLFKAYQEGNIIYFDDRAKDIFEHKLSKQSPDLSFYKCPEGVLVKENLTNNWVAMTYWPKSPVLPPTANKSITKFNLRCLRQLILGR